MSRYHCGQTLHLSRRCGIPPPPLRFPTPPKSPRCKTASAIFSLASQTNRNRNRCDFTFANSKALLSLQKNRRKFAEWNRKSLRFEIANSKSQCFLPVETAKTIEGAQTLRNKKSLRFLGGASSNRSVSVFLKSQRFRDAEIFRSWMPEAFWQGEEESALHMTPQSNSERLTSASISRLQKGPEKRGRAKSGEKCRKCFRHFSTIFEMFFALRENCRKVSRKTCLDTFWRFLKWPLSAGPFLQSAEVCKCHFERGAGRRQGDTFWGCENQRAPNARPNLHSPVWARSNWATDFYTPPVLGGAGLFDNSAPAVYKNPVP